jgi:prophage regulatory protein
MTDKNLRLPELRDKTGLSTTTIWRLEKDGKFPKRRRLSARCVAWLQSEVEAWIASREPLPSQASPNGEAGHDSE